MAVTCPAMWSGYTVEPSHNPSEVSEYRHRADTPHAARTSGPYPRRVFQGPTLPNALLSDTTMRGLIALSSSYDKPIEARVPGLKFARTTSACAASFLNTAMPSALRRFSPRLRRLR